MGGALPFVYSFPHRLLVGEMEAQNTGVMKSNRAGLSLFIYPTLLVLKSGPDDQPAPCTGGACGYLWPRMV